MSEQQPEPEQEPTATMELAGDADVIPAALLEAEQDEEASE